MIMVDQILNVLASVDNHPKKAIELLLEKEGEKALEPVDQLALGRGCLLVGKYEMALSYLSQALQRFDQLSHSLGRFYAYINLGIVYRENDAIEESLEAYNEAYLISCELDGFEPMMLALSHLASTYIDVDEGERAEVYFEKAIEYGENMGTSKVLGDVYNNYAFYMLENKNADLHHVLNYFFKAYEIYQVIYEERMHANLPIILSNIGDCYFRLKQYEEAERYVSESLKLAQEYDLKMVEMVNYEIISKIYQCKGDFKEAIRFLGIFSSLKEEMFNQEFESMADEIRKKYQMDCEAVEKEIFYAKNTELVEKSRCLEGIVDKLSVITHLGQRLASITEFENLYRVLKKDIAKMISFDLFGIALHDHVQGKIDYRYFEERGKEAEPEVIYIRGSKSLGAYAIVNEKDVYINHYDLESGFYQMDDDYISIGIKGQSTQSIIYCRLLTDQGCIGLITAQSYLPYQYTETDFKMIQAIASYAAIAISNAQKKVLIQERVEEMTYLSYRDTLTGLYNRRYFNKKCKEYALKPCQNLKIFVFDMNHLKEVNDSLGHLMGDRYLKEASKLIKKAMGKNEVFRIGGDEFAAFVCNSSEEGTAQILREIKSRAEEIQIGDIPLSIAVGYEDLMFSDESIMDVFSRAETKMYQDKKRYYCKRDEGRT